MGIQREYQKTKLNGRHDKDMEKLVSVILPTYNVEKYLSKCLKSISEQSYRNIEILVVIDGATDKSYEIAKEWEKKDERIKVIYQDNAGSGPARNNGLLHANGDFCMFVDPDDWIDIEMIEKMLNYQAEKDYDLVLTKCRTVSPEGIVIDEEKKTGIKIAIDKSQARNIYLELLGGAYLGAPTKKLFKMSLIRENNIKFPDLRRSQDIVFNYRYYNCIDNVIAVDDIYYNYMVDEKSYTSKLKSDYYKVLGFIFGEICTMCVSWGITLSGEQFQSACNYLFHSVVANLEANVLRKDDITGIINDIQIQKLTQGSMPIRVDERIIRSLILNKKYYLLRIVILNRHALKSLRSRIKK